MKKFQILFLFIFMYTENSQCLVSADFLSDTFYDITGSVHHALDVMKTKVTDFFHNKKDQLINSAVNQLPTVTEQLHVALKLLSTIITNTTNFPDILAMNTPIPITALVITEDKKGTQGGTQRTQGGTATTNNVATNTQDASSIPEKTTTYSTVDITKQRVKKAYTGYFKKLADILIRPSQATLNLKPTMSTPQLITFHGRRAESHTVTTDDGYFLTLHRIPPYTRLSKSKTVLLHHGILGSSADWVLLGPNDSLPYLLSDAGYDVWLANARGNYYSRGHLTKNDESDDYWKFSWQEIGQYDLPAVINYIIKIKDDGTPINYIGHSLGATALLVLLSVKPEYNVLIRMGVLLAPMAFMTDVRGAISMLASMAKDPPEQLLDVIGRGEFVASRMLPWWLAQNYCTGSHQLCCNPLFFLTGHSPKDQNSTTIKLLLRHVPAGGSTQTIMHYAQCASVGRFTEYGLNGTDFHLNRVAAPVVLMSSSDDWLATICDSVKLYSVVKNPVDHHVIRHHNLTHTDFIWGSKAKNLVFVKVMEYLKNEVDLMSTVSNEVVNTTK